jgi:hypothetical protein
MSLNSIIRDIIDSSSLGFDHTYLLDNYVLSVRSPHRVTRKRLRPGSTMFYHAQRSHLLQSVSRLLDLIEQTINFFYVKLDRLSYVYISYSYLVAPSLTALIARLVAQYRVRKFHYLLYRTN